MGYLHHHIPIQHLIYKASYDFGKVGRVLTYTHGITGSLPLQEALLNPPLSGTTLKHLRRILVAEREHGPGLATELGEVKPREGRGLILEAAGAIAVGVVDLTFFTTGLASPEHKTTCARLVADGVGFLFADFEVEVKA